MQASKDVKRIYLSPPHLSGKEAYYLDLALQQNEISSYGDNLEAFESAVAKQAGVNCSTALSSGTSAIHLALVLLGVKKEDEVIVSNFTYAASVYPILYQQADPIFVDSELKTWNMCPELLEGAIKDRLLKGKKPKAIILVHLYGMPSQMHQLMDIAKKYNIPVIEDAAEAMGATYKGKPLGGFGDIGVFSFNGNKIITTSGGGALVSNNSSHCLRAVHLATQARDEAVHYQHSKIGYNYRMSNLVAGMGRAQMEVLNDRVVSRRKNFDFYRKELEEFESISFLNEGHGFYANRWLTAIVTDSFETRERLRSALDNENIESRPLWKPMNLQPIFEKYPCYSEGVAMDLFERGLCLPSGSNLSKEDLHRVVEVIKRKL